MMEAGGANFVDWQLHQRALDEAGALRARVSELEAKLEAAEQHVTICQRLNRAEVERRRKVEAIAKEAASMLVPPKPEWINPDAQRRYDRIMDALRESEKP